MALAMERLLLAVLVLFVLWEVGIPIVRDRPIFPHFRRSGRLKKAKKDLDEVYEELQVYEVETDAERLRATIRKEHDDGNQNETPAPTTSGNGSNERGDEVPVKKGIEHA